MKKRTPAKRKPSSPRWGGVVAVMKYLAFAVIPALLLVVVLYAISRQVPTLFRVERILLTGNEHLTDEEVKALTGVREDNGLLVLSNREVREKLEASPWIRSVAVHKEFPNELHLKIRETSPFALLDLKGKMFIIDEEGRLLEELKSDSIPFLPLITGGDPYKKKEAYVEAIRLANVIRKTDLLANRERIEIVAASARDLSVILDGVLVKVGEGQYEEKLQRLAEIEDEVRRRNISIDYIDLRFARQVVVRPVTEVIQ